jgi:hypothetical protein
VETQPDRGERHQKCQAAKTQDHGGGDRRPLHLEVLVGDTTGSQPGLRPHQRLRKRFTDQHDRAVREAVPGPHDQRAAESLAAHPGRGQRLNGEGGEALQHTLARVHELHDRDAVAQPPGEVVPQFGVQALELGQPSGL